MFLYQIKFGKNKIKNSEFLDLKMHLNYHSIFLKLFGYEYCNGRIENSILICVLN